MRLYSVQHKDTEWAIPVAAETGRRAKKLAFASDWRGEFYDEHGGYECCTNLYWCMRVRWCREFAVEGPERVLTDEEAYAIGFWEAEA